MAFEAALALSECAAAPDPVDTSAHEAAVKAMTNAWIDAYNAGDVEKIVTMYPDDGVLIAAACPGCENARQQFAPL